MVNRPASKARKTPSTKKEFLLFISIPLSIIALVAAIVTVPSLFAKPKYDFIYSDCAYYACSNSLIVDNNGMLHETPSTMNVYASSTPAQIYYYSVATNASRKITLTEASNYNLDPSNVSPDGYTLQQANTSDSGFLFWGSSGDSNWYLKNGLKKKQVNLLNNYLYTGNVVDLVGWVQK